MECIYLTSVRKGSWEIVRVTMLRAGEMRAWDKVYPADVPFSPLRALLDAQEILNTDEKQYFYFESKELAERVESEYERMLSCCTANVSSRKCKSVELFCSQLIHRKWKPVFCFNGALSCRLHKNLEKRNFEDFSDD